MLPFFFSNYNTSDIHLGSIYTSEIQFVVHYSCSNTTLANWILHSLIISKTLNTTNMYECLKYAKYYTIKKEIIIFWVKHK